MLLVYMIIMTFTVSLMELLMCWSHLVSSLSWLEGMMLSLFIMATLMVLNAHFALTSVMPMVLLVFSAWETTLGLSLRVMVSNTYGTDYVQSLNLLQC